MSNRLVVQWVENTKYFHGNSFKIPLTIILDGFLSDLHIVYCRGHDVWMVKYQSDYRPDAVPLTVHGKTIAEAIDKMHDVLVFFTTSEQGE